MAHEPILPGCNQSKFTRYSRSCCSSMFASMDNRPLLAEGRMVDSDTISTPLGPSRQPLGDRRGPHSQSSIPEQNISGNHDRNNILRSCLQGKNGVIADAFRSYFTLQQGIREDRRKGYMNLDPCENSTIPRRSAAIRGAPFAKYEHSQQMANEYLIPMSQNTQLYRRDQGPSPRLENTCAHRVSLSPLRFAPQNWEVLVANRTYLAPVVEIRVSTSPAVDKITLEMIYGNQERHPPLIITNEIGIDFWTLREAGSIGESGKQDREVSKAELQTFIGSCARDSVISEACLASNYSVYQS
uniref:Uncharacterized protein n=1 Tax=Coccidioides posadasii RMSCC 3488 TaxID=454284 RepID=A0A0J6F3K0_COCPO|nr:hypothetical protein CPAG_00204 [Coccidioides posadasii RMSCC 3488]